MRGLSTQGLCGMPSRLSMLHVKLSFALLCSCAKGNVDKLPKRGFLTLFPRDRDYLYYFLMKTV